jgi:transposase InsO family protein
LNKKEKRLKALEAKVAQEGVVLTEEQKILLEKSRREKEATGEIETEHPGYLGCQDTFFVGTLKGVGRVYQQTFLDTYSRVAFAKLYTQKMALAAADLLDDRVIPFFEGEGVKLHRILTDNGREYCGREESHAYQLYLQLEEIEHSRTKVSRPWTNGITERFHRTILTYNSERPHQGKYCYGKTPLQTFEASKKLAIEKSIEQSQKALNIAV